MRFPVHAGRGPLGLLFVASVAAVVVACGDGKVEPQGRLLAPDTLSVCVDAPKYPFAFESSTGQWLGSDIEIAQHIADRLDLTLQVKAVPFDGIWRQPSEGACDLAVAAITITDGRRAEAILSQSYLDASQSLLVRAVDAETYDQLSGLGGHSIAVKSGTTSEAYVEAHLPGGATLVPYEETEEMFVALGAGDVDGVVSDLPLNGYRSTLDSALSVTEVIDTGEQYGFAAAIDNPDLIADVNGVLEDYLDSDEYAELLARWFNIR